MPPRFEADYQGSALNFTANCLSHVCTEKLSLIADSVAYLVAIKSKRHVYRFSYSVMHANIYCSFNHLGRRMGEDKAKAGWSERMILRFGVR